VKVVNWIRQKIGWATFWASFSKTHLVALPEAQDGAGLSERSVVFTWQKRKRQKTQITQWGQCYDFVNGFTGKKTGEKLELLIHMATKKMIITLQITTMIIFMQKNYYKVFLK
jgi:hypothetical protein